MYSVAWAYTSDAALEQRTAEARRAPGAALATEHAEQDRLDGEVRGSASTFVRRCGPDEGGDGQSRGEEAKEHAQGWTLEPSTVK